MVETLEEMKRYPEHALGRIQGTIWTSHLTDKQKLDKIMEIIKDWQNARGI